MAVISSRPSFHSSPKPPAGTRNERNEGMARLQAVMRGSFRPDVFSTTRQLTPAPIHQKGEKRNRTPTPYSHSLTVFQNSSRKDRKEKEEDISFPFFIYPSVPSVNNPVDQR
ncbi:hypothetical protein AVEN_201346-1 [Araneus ventricosus]|uniref:Uncharacterized protein n=1 Tax=Araneus ventricosus TaxID=182803 RepID=A0A4Y2M733_ARAVE|nr:hypothetical protein AVEN_201346-1 [Araneus ventricosus]